MQRSILVLDQVARERKDLAGTGDICVSLAIAIFLIERASSVRYRTTQA